MAARMLLAFCVIALAIVGCVHAQGETAAEAYWDRQNVETLIGFIDNIAGDGLDPARYDAADLKTALRAGDEAATDAAATKLFGLVAADLSAGVIPRDSRRRWFIAGAAVDPAAINAAMEHALAAHHVAETLASFEPPQSQYKALKAALAKTPASEPEQIARLRANMERWRWMPRALGRDYILVNIPSFELVVVRDGVEIDRRRVIVGTAKRPTPQFAATVTGVSFNPTWYVPPSIVAESIGALLERDPKKAQAQGYYVAPDGGVRQKPGPFNALGEMKLEMPNPYRVYLHDTPAKSLFKRETRALSHSCIRVEGALDFARVLLAPGWNDKMIAEVVSTGSTVTVDLPRPMPVYVTYFTATAKTDGSVSFAPDIYGLDRALFADFDHPQDTDEQALQKSASLGECRG